MSEARAEGVDRQRAAGASRPSWLRGLLVGVWKFAVGALLCLTPLLSVLAAGWLLRMQRRRVVIRWYQRSDPRPGDDFARFAAADPATASLLHWPNWLCAERRGAMDSGSGGALRTAARSLLGALWANAHAGAASLFNTWVLTLPACTLWLFAWWGGWENSFNKGYEQHWVGPTVFIAGGVMFAIAMIHVPLAQARHAVSGEWRAFYDVALIRTLVREKWLSCLFLALLHVLVALPVMGLKMLPMRLDAIIGDFATLGDAEIRHAAFNYYLLATAIVFAALIVLRSVTARIYADALLAAIRNATLTEDRLSVAERTLLRRLDLLRVAPQSTAHPLFRAVRWLGTRSARRLGTALTLALWGVFVFQLVVAQFINHVWVGWLSHPLIHLPWLWQGPAG